MTPKEAIDYLIDPIGKRDQHDEAIDMAIEALRARQACEQIRWERDIAIQQLADLGYSLGEKPRTNSSETPNNSKWVRVSADRYTRSANYIYKCSKCGEHTVGMPRYCPNCGAKMEVHNGDH